jgi:hypothetical protein
MTPHTTRNHNQNSNMAPYIKPTVAEANELFFFGWLNGLSIDCVEDVDGRVYDSDQGFNLSDLILVLRLVIGCT